jgi:membrane protease subunit (stomatin/prohibitin family)
LAASHAQAKAEAAREQLHEKARATDYSSKIDMGADSVLKAPTPPAVAAEAAAAQVRCISCGSEVGKAKFCPECGTPVKPARPTCSSCGHQPEAPTKFCPECGGKMPVAG